MRQFFIALVFAFLFAPVICRSQNEAVAQNQSIEPENMQITPMRQEKNEILTRLPNGLLIYIFKDARFPLSCARLYVRAGSANEERSQAGISHVLEHMVFKGTKDRPKGQVAKDVEELGGYLNASTSFDKTWYITDMAAKHWQVGMDVVYDMAFQATLDPAELESEKNVVVSELQRGEDSPQRKLFENLQTAALANTSYGWPIIGFEDTIRSLTVEDLKNYIKKWYQPQNMMLLVGGDINPEEVLAYAQKLFGKLENSSDLAVQEPFNPATAAYGSQRVETMRGPWNKVYLGLAIPVPGMADLQSIDLDLLSYLLGGDGTSFLDQKYRYDLQLVDGVSADNMSLDRLGMLTITATLDAAKLEEFWNRLTQDLAALSSKDFSEAALARAKYNLEDSMDRAGETLSGLVRWKAAVQFDLGGETGEENIRFTQKNATLGQIQEAIANWLDSGYIRVRALIPEGAGIPDLEGILQKNWPAKAQKADSGKEGSGQASVEYIPLDNDCQLILTPDDSAPYISIVYKMAGGNALLEENEQGLASLTARLLTDGSGELNKSAMERWLAERAASAGAAASLQTFSVSMDGPARFANDYFGMLKKILFNPKFAPQELQREVADMKSAIARRNDQPLSFMISRVNPFLFPHQPYGYDSLGTTANLDKFNAVNVRDFWAKQNAQPWILSIAGSFDREDAVKFAKALPSPRSPKFVLKTPEWDEKKNLSLELPGKKQAHLMRIFKTVPADHPDAPALTLLEAALSGQSGPLFTQLRDEQGLGYTVTAFNRMMPKAGYITFYIGTTPDKIDQSKAGFEAVIEQIKTKPLPEAEVRAAANKLLGDYVRGRQSLAARASEPATDAILDYPHDYQKILIEKASTLGPEDLQEMAKKYLVNPYDVILQP